MMQLSPTFKNSTSTTYTPPVSSKQKYSSEDLISDHRAIEFTIEVAACRSNSERKCFRFDLADWKLFRGSMDVMIDLNVALNSCTDIDNEILKFIGLIRDAVKVAVPQKKYKSRQLYVYAVTRDMIRIKNNFKRMWR